MITQTTRETLAKYIQLCSWFYLKEEDPSIAPEQFEIVIREIETLEDKLRLDGVSNDAIGQVIAITKENTLQRSISELNEAQLLEVCKLIFGKEVEFARG